VYSDYPIFLHSAGKMVCNQADCFVCHMPKQELCIDHSAGMRVRGRCFILLYVAERYGLIVLLADIFIREMLLI
jgi:hypothetical protein